MLEILNKYYDAGWLIKQSHPELPLTIWNYSKSTQYDGKWDDVTLICRGLVTDDNTGEIVARPFKKFFNIEEAKHTPTKDFDVFTKEDGSLCIVFYYNGEWITASRGSFTSDQAIWSRNYINTKLVNGVADILDENYTYLFETIYKENRIVVDYGDYEGVILLGAINTKTGEELCYERLLEHSDFFDVVKRWDGIADFTELKGMITDNAEGFVIRFSNGDRMKIKGDEYVRLHKIMTEISTTAIWEGMMMGWDMGEVLGELPDEFYSVIREFEAELNEKYSKVSHLIIKLFKERYYDGMDAKEFANSILDVDKRYHPLLFNQYRMNFTNYSNIIFNLIKPKWRKL
jgi:RNA ligase